MSFVRLCSSSVRMPVDSMVCKARWLALNSTGRVANWNTTERPKTGDANIDNGIRELAQTGEQDAQQNQGMASLEPMFVTGMMAARS